MRKSKVFPKVLFVIILLLSIAVIFGMTKPIERKFNKMQFKSELVRVEEENLQSQKNNNDLAAQKSVKFARDGIDNIAYVTMVKDEDDIIYENLVWHFCIGFRKFVIVDNNSTDGTRALIEKFKKQVENKAVVVIIDDPIVEYIQSKIMTGAMRFAHSVWSDLDWVFPVDADEFWYPNIQLKDILSKIPDNQEVIFTLQHNHVPVEEFKDNKKREVFYKNLNYRLKDLSDGFGKIAVRPGVDVIISQGNHSARTIMHKRGLGYAAGNEIGLDMRHFQMRSVFQVEKKYWNGAKANIRAQKLGLINKDHGSHWTAFKKEVDEKGLRQSATDRFNSYVKSKDICIEDPLPMENAFELFNELISQ